MAENKTIIELNKLLHDFDVHSLENVSIEGDIEIHLGSGGGGLNPVVAYALGQEAAQIGIHLQNIARVLGYPVDQLLASQGMGIPVSSATAGLTTTPAITKLIPAKFSVGKMPEWKHKIEEVTLGAGSADGGTRKKTITLGGESALPYHFDAEMPHRNYVTMDVFDMPINMAKSVKSNYEDVINDPAEWAKKVEDILQAVDVPIVIGGSGNPEKDPAVLEKAAEAAEGERCLLASASLNLDYARIAAAAKKHNHVILSWTQLEINAQKELNRKLMKQCGMQRSDIVMDPTTAALGYGLDYAYTNMERIRIAGLTGDSELAFPMSSGTTNAWGARESWMIESPLSQDSDWGPREYRGPIWEIVTGLSLALAGNDLFMMMHPTSVQVLKEITQTLYGSIKTDDFDISNWIGREVSV